MDVKATNTFFFYDLETSGINPRRDRIMQFAGQRTDMELRPIGEPVNMLIKLAGDVLPDPYAIQVTGITPQKTISEGVSEAEFCRFFCEKVVVPNTIFVGFNNVRFDDEFIRHLLYRNFCDAYEWQYKDGRSRWDILDVSRMMRALRPEGVKWPFNGDGKPSNRLELLASANKLLHSNAHDALSDVQATIEMTKLIRKKQPNLYDYLLKMRDKDKIKQLVAAGNMFVYSSGKYSGEFEKTTVGLSLGLHPDKNSALVYDLRVDPKKFIDLPSEQLAKLWQYDKEKKTVPLPVKALKFNRCPAIAPLGVLDKPSQKRLGINLDKINENAKTVKKSPVFFDNLAKALDIINRQRQKQAELVEDRLSVDEKLYDGFIPNGDRTMFKKIRGSKPDKLMEFKNYLKDERLRELLFLYKGRNFKKSLTGEELEQWESYRRTKLMSGGNTSQFALFGKKLEELAKTSLSSEQKYLLEELQLYGLSLRPGD